jgi:hypothetical protein
MAAVSATVEPRRSRLRLKSDPHIGVGLLFGPWAGLTVLWLMLVVPLTFQSGPAWAAPLAAMVVLYGYMMFFGVVVCLAVEAVTVVPLLLGFRRYRWRWLNGWTAALIGFSTGFGLALLVGAMPPVADFSQTGRSVTVLHGHRTLAGWIEVLNSSLMIGVVGLVAAIVFRLIAVEREPDDPAGVS